MDLLLNAPTRLPTNAAGGARQTNIRRTLQIASGAIQINGSGTPAAVADLVMRRIEERERQQRDGGHPQDAED